ncbi:hypothetical protein M8J77_020594 [Diaphorina citri]|nr:hypothetical protein M8J77_020594 [Diaphorina citri]
MEARKIVFAAAGASILYLSTNDAASSVVRRVGRWQVKIGDDRICMKKRDGGGGGGEEEGDEDEKEE